jgi:hypothetical protein
MTSTINTMQQEFQSVDKVYLEAVVTNKKVTKKEDQRGGIGAQKEHPFRFSGRLSNLQNWY